MSSILFLEKSIFFFSYRGLKWQMSTFFVYFFHDCTQVRKQHMSTALHTPTESSNTKWWESYDHMKLFVWLKMLRCLQFPTLWTVRRTWKIQRESGWGKKREFEKLFNFIKRIKKMVALQSVEDCCAHFILPLQVSVRVKQTNKQNKQTVLTSSYFFSFSLVDLCSYSHWVSSLWISHLIIIFSALPIWCQLCSDINNTGTKRRK